MGVNEHDESWRGEVPTAESSSAQLVGVGKVISHRLPNGDIAISRADDIAAIDQHYITDGRYEFRSGTLYLPAGIRYQVNSYIADHKVFICSRVY